MIVVVNSSHVAEKVKWLHGFGNLPMSVLLWGWRWSLGSPDVDHRPNLVVRPGVQDDQHRRRPQPTRFEAGSCSARLHGQVIHVKVLYRTVGEIVLVDVQLTFRDGDRRILYHRSVHMMHVVSPYASFQRHDVLVPFASYPRFGVKQVHQKHEQNDAVHLRQTHRSICPPVIQSNIWSLRTLTATPAVIPLFYCNTIYWLRFVTISKRSYILLLHKKTVLRRSLYSKGAYAIAASLQVN